MSNIFDLFKKIEKKESFGPVSFIVAGLGNPGQEYARTRHNAGFMAIDYIAECLGVRIDRARFSALTCEATIGGVRVLLMKPETFMNNSGIAVGEAMRYYKLSPEQVLILHDEINFGTGVLRIRRKGSSGGHNGLKSIEAHLSSDAYARIKIGVGQKPSADYDLVNWVLGRFSDADIKLLADRFADVSGAVELIVGGRIDEAMQRYPK